MERSFSLKIHDPGHVLPADQDGAPLLKTVQAGQPCFAETLGWHCVEQWAGTERLAEYRALADEVCRDADAMAVVGIGGSNQGARAVIDALGRRPDHPEIIWAGNTISPHSMADVLEKLKEKKSVYVNVIAKNFETLEPGIGFRVLRQYLQQTYGPGWEKRVIATGTRGSRLEELCTRHGFRFLPFPEDIGGRFTALSPVGLFPMAVAGVDIGTLAQGALDMERRLKADCGEGNPVLVYAQARNSLYAAGRRVEMLAFFEPRLFRFSKWWVQLFGESEGKDGKGLYPVAASYSEDLHSIGPQYPRPGRVPHLEPGQRGRRLWLSGWHGHGRGQPCRVSGHSGGPQRGVPLCGTDGGRAGRVRLWPDVLFLRVRLLSLRSAAGGQSL